MPRLFRPRFSTFYDGELVGLIGVSMGGVIARLAATRAEDEGLNLPVAALITMDSPHQGAVIDPELQSLMLIADLDAALLETLFQQQIGMIQRETFNPLVTRNFGNQASRELLQFNITNVPANAALSIHQQFYQELDALNGNAGYPLEIPTIATAFSFDAPNPNAGNVWFEAGFVDVPTGTVITVAFFSPISGAVLVVLDNQDLITLEVDGPLAAGGSYLPTSTTNFALPLEAILEVNRTNNHPTFIPWTSALDMTNGVSPIRYTISSNDPDPSFHDQIPGNVVDQIRDRIRSFSPPTIPVARTYNFTRQVGSDIRQNMEVFGTLRINESGYSGFADDPEPGSSFTSYSVSTQGCEPISVDIRNGGVFHLGEGGSRTSTVRIREGASVILRSGSTLRIDDNSTLIIEPGATFRVENGASIQLLGNNAVLQIEGDLVLGSGATFGFSGSGFVRLGLPNQPGGQYANVILDGNGPHGISLTGSSPADKVLEIMPFTYLGPDYGLDEFTIQNGRVELGEDAHLNTGYADLTLLGVHFTATNPNEPFRTIFGNGQANHLISQIEIDHADIGIDWRAYMGDQASLTMSNSFLHDCDIAIQTQSKSASLSDLTLANNINGWKALYHSGFGSFANSEVANLGLGRGIWQSGSGHVQVTSSSFTGGATGIWNDGTGASTLTCTNITTGATGIYQSLGGWVVMDNQRRNSVKGDYFNILLDGSWYTFLYQGKNKLVPASPNGNGLAIYGTILFPVPTMFANNNNWNNNTPNPIPAGPNPGTAPSSPFDYILNSSQGSVTIADPGPVAFLACGSGGGPSMDWVAPCTECPMVATSAGNLRLDQALNAGMNELLLPTYDYRDPLDAAQIFLGNLNHSYTSITPTISSYLDIAAYRLREAVEAGIHLNQIETAAAQHSPALTGWPATLHTALGRYALTCANLGRPEAAFFLRVEQALIYNTVDRPATAQSALLALRSEAPAGTLPLIDNWTCFLDVRNQVLLGQLTPEEADSLLELCPVLDTYTGEAQAPARLQATAAPVFTLDLMPNPAQGRVQVVFSSQTSATVAIRLFSLTGQTMQALAPVAVEAGEHVFKLDISRLPSGYYVVECATPGEMLRKSLLIQQ